MDKELQKEILKMFLEKDGNLIQGRHIFEKIKQIYFLATPLEVPLDGKIQQQIDLLIDDEALMPKNDLFYRITEWGELRARGGIKKYWYWLINKKHNLISFVTLGISGISLIIALIGLFVVYKK
jgi:hypothetical protein